MSIAELGALGEFIASIAVVVSVLYLATQIRAQRTEQKQQAAKLLTDGWNEAGRSVSENADLAKIYFHGLESYLQLDSVEKLRFANYLTRVLKSFEDQHALQTNGVLEEDAWQTSLYNLELIAKQPGFREYWDGRDQMFKPHFRALVKDAMSKPGDGITSKLYAS